MPRRGKPHPELHHDPFKDLAYVMMLLPWGMVLTLFLMLQQMVMERSESQTSFQSSTSSEELLTLSEGFPLTMDKDESGQLAFHMGDTLLSQADVDLLLTEKSVSPDPVLHVETLPGKVLAEEIVEFVGTCQNRGVTVKVVKKIE